MLTAKRLSEPKKVIIHDHRQFFQLLVIKKNQRFPITVLLPFTIRHQAKNAPIAILQFIAQSQATSKSKPMTKTAGSKGNFLKPVGGRMSGKFGLILVKGRKLCVRNFANRP